jgi:hypothetical protein
MKRTRNVLLLCIASVWCAGASAQHVTEVRAAVLAQNLKQLESTGKVKTALWTLRNDSCTLQLILPWGTAPTDPGTLSEVVLHGAGLAGPLPAVKVWLLTADGTQISATNVSRPDPAKFSLRTIAAEFSYSFPRSANGEAVAAAIQIGDDFYVEKLEKLADLPQ